jgi:parallel beta-helix repeat protein
MAKLHTLWGLLFSLLLLAGLIGCSDPTSNPPPPKETDKTGTPLDVNSNHITAAGSPYLVSEDWVIDSTRTVTIDPGTVIMFKGLVWLDVAGKLDARGNAEFPITFTTSKLEPELGQWRGVKLRSNDPSLQSVFQHCVFSYGAYYDTDTTKLDTKLYKGMLCVNNCSPTIEHCVIIYNQNNGVYITGTAAAPRVRYNIVTKNDAMAIRADTLVTLPTELGQAGRPDVSYNCVGENSAIPFLMARDTLLYGLNHFRNRNLDSVDFFYNLNLAPSMTDPDNGNFALTSCSPAVDAGPDDVDHDPDGTRADMGSIPYVQVPGELRGLIYELPPTADGFYRVSCNVRVDSATTLTIPAGTRIEVAGYYTIEIEGHLRIEGTAENRVEIYASATDSAGRWGGILLGNTDGAAHSVFRYVDMDTYQRFIVLEPGVEFTGCRFYHGYQYGLDLQVDSRALTDAATITNCSFVECGQFGVRTDSCTALIRNSAFLGNRGRGITMNSCGDLGVIENCIIQGNGTTGIALELFSSPRIVNNTIVGNSYFGIDLNNNCDPETRNNIVIRNGLRGLNLQLSSEPVINYNDVWGHTSTSGATDYVPSTTAHPTDLNVDPLFTSYPTDLHLQAGSPARNAGDPGADYYNADGSRNDMGAYGGPRGQNGVGSSGLRTRTAPLASK